MKKQFVKNEAETMRTLKKVVKVDVPYDTEPYFFVHIQDKPTVLVEFWPEADITFIYLPDEWSRGDLLTYYMGRPSWVEEDWVDHTVLPALERYQSVYLVDALKDQVSAQEALIGKLKELNELTQQMHEKDVTLDGLRQIQLEQKEAKLKELREVIRRQTKTIEDQRVKLMEDRATDEELEKTRYQLRQQKKIIDGQRKRLSDAQTRYKMLVDHLIHIWDECQDETGGDMTWYYGCMKSLIEELKEG